MKKIALVASKGGTGKTTLSAHIGVEASRRDLSCALIDLDPQGSLTRWHEAREAEEPALIPSTTAQLGERIDQIAETGAALSILDTPPGHMATLKAALSVCDFALIPVTPSPVDILAIGPALDATRQSGKAFAFILNRADLRRRAAMEAALLLSQHGVAAPSPVRDLAAFASAMTDGRTAQEIEPKGAAASDIGRLFDFIAMETKI